MRRYQVVWKGPTRKNSGLGIASRAYVQALRRQGVNVKVRTAPLGIGNNGKRILIHHYSPDRINFNKERRYFDHIILNTVWETSRIPTRWVPYMNKFDLV